ncbi:TetR/AcrR family transcriptional regulator [Microbacterium sp. AZCO]|uniref:TetR/AcrR family transcriptional regulator n=1 Tax=Microbacterium sp. AZCO TaxID=3142976 RepID=UPI0031F34877
MATGQRKGTYEKGRLRREAIVDAATDRFVEVGYLRASLAQIAADVGITEGGLLHHFPSRMHLLVAVLDRRLARTAEWWQAEDVEGDPVGVMKRIIRTGRQLTAEPGLIELFVKIGAEAADPTSPAHELYAERYADVIQSAAREIASGVDAGYFRDDLDPVRIAREVIAVSDGLQLQWVLAGGELDLVEGIRAHAIGLAERIVVEPHRDRIGELRTT